MRARTRFTGSTAAGIALLMAVALAGCGGADAEQVAIPECNGAEGLDFDCLADRYTTLAGVDGVEAALTELEGDIDGGGFVQSACHQLVHRIGRDAGAELGIGAFEGGSSLCAAGYYHGVTEAVMDELGIEAATVHADEVCAALRDADPHSADHYNCVHGMGHGFMRLHERDVFDSLGGCDGLAEGWEREKCYSGVFMENLAAVDDPDAEYLDPERPLYPCTDVAARYKPPCYDRQTTYALYVTGTDFAGVFELCGTAESDFQSACYAGLGGDVAAETKLISDTTEQAMARVRLCFQGNTFEARSNCVAGAVRVALRDAADGEKQAQALCSSLTDARLHELHEICRAAAERSYRELPEDRGASHRHAQHH